MEDFNKNIVDNIDVFMKENENKKPVNWACELYVSGIYDNLLNRKEFRELKKPILENAKVLCAHMDYDLENYRLKIRDCWLNAYDKGNTQESGCSPRQRTESCCCGGGVEARVARPPPTCQTTEQKLLFAALKGREGRVCVTQQVERTTV